MKLSSNILVDKLLILLNEDKDVVGVSFQKKGHLPPDYAEFELADGSTEKVDLHMSYDEYEAAYKVFKAWWNAIHKIKIQDIET